MKRVLYLLRNPQDLPPSDFSPETSRELSPEMSRDFSPEMSPKMSPKMSTDRQTVLIDDASAETLVELIFANDVVVVW